MKSQDKYKKVEDMYLLFAKKASAFNSWFENAEEDLTDPVRCNSVEEIMVGCNNPVPQTVLGLRIIQSSQTYLNLAGSSRSTRTIP